LPHGSFPNTLDPLRCPPGAETPASHNELIEDGGQTQLTDSWRVSSAA
jgi:hypothetical protein